MLVVLVVAPRTPRAKLERVAAALAKHPAVRGVVAVDERSPRRRDRAGRLAAPTVLLGDGHLVEAIAGVGVEVGAGEFLQVNRAQAAAMYARVAELARGRPGGARSICSPGSAASACTSRARASTVDRRRDRSRRRRRAPARRARGLPLTAIAGDAAAIRELGAPTSSSSTRRARGCPPTRAPCSPGSPAGHRLRQLRARGARPRPRRRCTATRRRDRAVRPDAGHRADRDGRAPTAPRLARRAGS